MKLLALKLPLATPPLKSLSNLERALANHFAYQYFKKYLIRINRDEDLTFWEAARLRGEIRREAQRASEANYGSFHTVRSHNKLSV
jgi:hypothetical protein